ncbi:MAG: phenylalanine--tRNA ligase subunit alpha [Candidatus Desulforudis sp.]|nr:phenylalanine--tRNA ligase subunit alpha [Desulforudis sp.]
MREELSRIVTQAEEAIAGAQTVETVEELRIRYLGKKGVLTRVLRGMGSLPPAERPLVGKLANEIKVRLEADLAARISVLKEKEKERKLAAEKLDVTLPGTRPFLGSVHPLTAVRTEIEDIFLGLGFQIVEGPEVEHEYYNFEALNFPRDHPARDMQDTFFVSDEVLLRTHTSPVQVRTFEKTAPEVPVKIIAPGKVYREDDDATHSPMFNQIEGFAVDTRITLGDLKGVLHSFVRQLYGEKTRMRFRASFFPFTEPSAEVDISCVICGGHGCRVCSHTGWLEILGAGMIHPRVLEVSGYDTEKVSGFAFGMGIERIAMLKYGVDNIRLFFDNDLRFLQQF